MGLVNFLPPPLRSCLVFSSARVLKGLKSVVIFSLFTFKVLFLAALEGSWILASSALDLSVLDLSASVFEKLVFKCDA